MPLIFGPPNIKKLITTGNVRGLIKVLASQKDKESRDGAVAALVDLGQKGPIDDLVKALDDKDPFLRKWTVIALAETKQPWVTEVLITALQDKDPEVRCNAIRGLANFRNDEALGAIITSLADKDKQVSRAAVAALAALQVREAVQPIVALLNGSDLELRREAASALGKIGDPQAVRPLIAALKDHDRIVRQYAASALGNIGDPEAFGPLTEVAEHDPLTFKDPFSYAVKYPVREEAYHALRKLGVGTLDKENENLARELLRLLKEFSRAWDFHSSQYVFNELNQTFKNIEDNILANGGKERMQLVARRVMQIAMSDPVFYEKLKKSNRLSPWL